MRQPHPIRDWPGAFMTQFTDSSSTRRRRHVGPVDGGKLLEWIDKVAFAAAAQWSGRYCVTAYVGNVHFDRPIHVGELVELHATLVHTGRTSMHILVTVYSSDPTRRNTPRRRSAFSSSSPSMTTGRPLRFRAGTRRRCSTATATPSTGPHFAAQTHRSRDGGANLHRRRHRSSNDLALPGRSHRRQLGRQGARRPSHAWIDEAAYVCGADWAGAQVISSYIGGDRFYRPINIGNVIEVTARIIHTGPRSIHTSVHVATSDTQAGTPALAAHALAVFVALDDKGKAQPIRKWEPVSKEDHRLDQHARDLIGLRELVEPFTPSASMPADAEPNYYHVNAATT